MPTKLQIKAHSAKSPSAGIWYHVEDGFRFEGETPELVAKQLKQYRLGHQKEVGDPLQDVYRSVCMDYPHLFIKAHCDEYSDIDDLGKDLESWAIKQTSCLQDMEIDLIANAREKVCLKCPHHSSFTVNSKGEQDRYEQIIAKITNGKSMKKKRLNGCGKFRMDCRVMVYTKSEELPESDLAYCWIKKDLSDFIEA